MEELSSDRRGFMLWAWTVAVCTTNLLVGGTMFLIYVSYAYDPLSPYDGWPRWMAMLLGFSGCAMLAGGGFGLVLANRRRSRR